jgi:c-di-GMP-binding flagellar brake protein YcgR
MENDPKNAKTRSVDNLDRLCGQQVSITLGHEDRQYFCNCRGVCSDRFVMVQTPPDPDIQKKLETGEPAVIRFVESGMVCGFKTRINKAITFPFRLIFFDYPDNLEVVNLRNSKRVSLHLKADIQWHGEAYTGVIKDLSEGGCFFVIKYWQDEAFNDLGMESAFPIKFKIQGDKTPIELKARVVRMNKDKEEFRMGLAFDGGQKEETGRISDFVSFISQLLESEGAE